MASSARRCFWWFLWRPHSKKYGLYTCFVPSSFCLFLWRPHENTENTFFAKNAPFFRFFQIFLSPMLLSLFFAIEWKKPHQNRSIISRVLKGHTDRHTYITVLLRCIDIVTTWNYTTVSGEAYNIRKSRKKWRFNLLI